MNAGAALDLRWSRVDLNHRGITHWLMARVGFGDPAAEELHEARHSSVTADAGGRGPGHGGRGVARARRGRDDARYAFSEAFSSG